MSAALDADLNEGTRGFFLLKIFLNACEAARDIEERQNGKMCSF